MNKEPEKLQGKSWLRKVLENLEFCFYLFLMGRTLIFIINGWPTDGGKNFSIFFIFLFFSNFLFTHALLLVGPKIAFHFGQPVQKPSENEGRLPLPFLLFYTPYLFLFQYVEFRSPLIAAFYALVVLFQIVHTLQTQTPKKTDELAFQMAVLNFFTPILGIAFAFVVGLFKIFLIGQKYLHSFPDTDLPEGLKYWAFFYFLFSAYYLKQEALLFFFKKKRASSKQKKQFLKQKRKVNKRVKNRIEN